jgi:hypothetical protein
MAKTLKKNSLRKTSETKRTLSNSKTKDTGNKLTLQELIKIDEANDAITIVPVRGFHIGVNKIFKNTKIRDLVGDFVGIHAKFKEQGLDTADIDFSGLGFILIIEYFTDINVPEDIAGKLEYLEYLINADMLSPILESFGEGQLKKAVDMMNSYTENVKELFKTEEEKASALKEKEAVV